MRYRYNFLKFTIGRWKRKSMEEVNRDMNVKFTKAEILALVCMALIFLAIYIPHEVASGIIALIAMACYVVATIWDCFNYGPITRWRHATIKSAIGATLWTVMPIIIYYSGEGTAEDYKEMLYISLINHHVDCGWYKHIQVGHRSSRGSGTCCSIGYEDSHTT